MKMHRMAQILASRFAFIAFFSLSGAGSIPCRALADSSGLRQASTENSVTVKEIRLTDNRVRGGGNLVGVVILTSKAPVGGAVVTLQSDAPAIVPMPQRVVVPQGRTSAPFFAHTAVVKEPKMVMLGASPGDGKTTRLTICPYLLTDFTLNIDSVQPGQELTGLIRFDSEVGSDTEIEIVSDNTAVVCPSKPIILAKGESHTTFDIQTHLVTSRQTVHLTVTAGGQSKSAMLILTP